jgi:tetratricopeptide (TPR) repeat protein
MLKESLTDYDRLLDIDPNNIDARFYRGVVQERMGNLDQAIADFSIVLELEPNHIKASYARGSCQNLKGEFAEAIRTLARPTYS